MKIIKISGPNGSYCSTDFSLAAKELRKKIKQSLKDTKTNGKFIVEVFDMNDGSLSLSPKLENPFSGDSGLTI